uniref:Uncharacterized protein n=1 Tax=Anopheles melas TaxID=34690 RepID=A0A182UCT4_9DIPT
MRGSFLRLDQLTGSARKTLANDEPKVPDIVNSIYAALVIGPLVICFWRGTWNLMDMLLFPEDEVLRMITLQVFGLGGHLLFMLLQTTLERWLDVEVRPVSFYLLSRVYTYIYGAMCVATWRGGWILIDRYSPPSLVFFMEASLVALLLLGSVQSFCNVAGAPFVNDSPDGYFDVPTYFKSKLSASRLGSFSEGLLIRPLTKRIRRGVRCDAPLRPTPKQRGARNASERKCVSQRSRTVRRSYADHTDDVQPGD